MWWIIGFVVAVTLPVIGGLIGLYQGLDLAIVRPSVTFSQLILIGVVGLSWKIRR